MSVQPVESGIAVARGGKLVLLDVSERLIVTFVFGSFAWRMGHSYLATSNWLTLLLCISEALPFIYIVLRAPSPTLSRDPFDWILGTAGTIMPLLVGTVEVAPLVPVTLCLLLMVAGLCTQIAAKIVLGRAFGIIAANRGVRVAGPYRFVRHPMYAGYTLTQIGFLLSMPSAMNAALYAAALSLQLARIHREERVLMRDPAYRAFAARVRYRLLPGVF